MPRLFCAAACPWSAARRSHRAAFASSCATPRPVKHEAKGKLPGGMTFFGRAPEPGHGNGVVLHHAATVLVPLAELRLRLGVSGVGQLAESSNAQLGDVSFRRVASWRVGRRGVG